MIITTRIFQNSLGTKINLASGSAARCFYFCPLTFSLRYHPNFTDPASASRSSSSTSLLLQTIYIPCKNDDAYKKTGVFSSHVGDPSCRCMLCPKDSHTTLQLRHSINIPIHSLTEFLFASGRGP